MNSDLIERIEGGYLRYVEFHRRAAVRERMGVVKELRALEAHIARHGYCVPKSRLHHVRLRMQMALNRRARKAGEA